MAGMLILILQLKYEKKFVGTWYFIMKGSILVDIYLMFGCFKILLSARVDSSVKHQTRVGTSMAKSSKLGFYIPYNNCFISCSQCIVVS